MKTLLIVLITAGLALPLDAQVSAYLQNPSPVKVTLYDLHHFTVINPTQKSFSIMIRGRAEEIDGMQKVVAETKSVPTTIKLGSNIFSRHNLSFADVNFLDTKFEEYYNLTGQFPPGNYRLCIRLFDESSEDMLGEFCINVNSVHPSPLVLASPYDKEELLIKTPHFLWIPPASIPGLSMNYGFELVEILEGQDKQEALAVNPPLLKRTGLSANFLSYPVTETKLEVDHKYAWRVKAYSNSFLIDESDIWEFTLVEPEPERKEKAEMPVLYYDLKEKLDATYANITGVIHSKFNNEYNQRVSSIRILNDKSEEVTPDHLIIKEVPGDNSFDIDLQGHREFKSGEMYILEITNQKGERYVLRFKYHKP